MMLTHTIPALLCDRTTAGRVDKRKPQRPKLVGYYTKGKTPNWTRLKEYNAWKDHVRESVEQVLTLPTATEAQPVRVDVWCFFADRTHNDPENVRKGIVDALFPAGDKYVYGYHHYPQYDAKNPRVLLSISQGAG